MNIELDLYISISYSYIVKGTNFLSDINGNYNIMISLNILLVGLKFICPMNHHIGNAHVFEKFQVIDGPNTSTVEHLVIHHEHFLLLSGYMSAISSNVTGRLYRMDG